ncbi:MAG: DUF2007 domain-containing protein [Cypionkella sp.]|nr:DUF2007 domain-containing protein [Cypionkella sp.]
MKLLLSTTDPTAIPFAQVLLQGEGIDSFALDVHMHALQGAMGVLPRRLMVHGRDHFRARAVLLDNGFAAHDLGA